jgi:hypothetical protein
MLEKLGGNSGLDMSGVEERRALIGQFLVDLPKGSVKTMLEPHPVDDIEYLVVKTAGHEIKLHPASVGSTIDGQPIKFDESKQLWDKFKPIHDNKDSEAFTPPSELQ